MGSLHRGDEQSEPASAAAEAPKLTELAHERLEDLSGADAIFTSGLSVNEFALLRGLGPTPLAQVMGASVVRTGWQYLPALEPGIAAYVTPGFGGTATLRQNRWGNPFGEAPGAQ